MRTRVSIPEFSLYWKFPCPTRTNLLCPVYPGLTVVKHDVVRTINTGMPAYPLLLMGPLGATSSKPSTAIRLIICYF
jgi:hypothetical protein